MSIGGYYRSSVWRTLPGRSYALLLLAIFFSFSSIGYINDLLRGCTLPPDRLFLSVVYSGLLGVGYGHGAMRNWRFFLPTAAGHVAGALAFSGMAAPAIVPGPALSDRLVLDGIGLFVSMILGYVLFIIFISGQGIRHIRLRTEIDLAREIQTVLVPPIALTQAGIDIYGASLPASEVGGDMLDVATLHETITCCVADIAGHGVGANLLMGMFKSSFRTRIRQRGDLATLMTDVNEALYPLRKPSMFLTVAAVQFNGGPDVHFLVAGHLPILHYRATEGAVVKLTTRQIALGMQPGYRFAQGSARVAEGDCLVIATDGMTEVENRNREPFGIERLASLVRDQHSRSPRELYAAIRTAVERHGRQRDDQTLMVIRRQEAEPSPRSESR